MNTIDAHLRLPTHTARRASDYQAANAIDRCPVRITASGVRSEDRFLDVPPSDVLFTEYREKLLEYETYPSWVPTLDKRRAVRSNRSGNNGRLRVRSEGQLSRKSSKRVQTGEPTQFHNLLTSLFCFMDLRVRALTTRHCGFELAQVNGLFSDSEVASGFPVIEDGSGTTSRAIAMFGVWSPPIPPMVSA